MTQTILTLLSYMVAFAVALLPVTMVVFFKRLNLGYKYDYQSMLRVAPISVVLIIVSAYKVLSIALYANQPSPNLNANISLFFALTFIVCIFLSIYFIIDRAILHFKPKPKRLLLNVSAGITILFAIFTIFSLISKSQQNQLNYIDLAVTLISPSLTGVLSFAGIISLLFYKRTSKSQRVYSIIFISSIPLWTLDIIFAEQNLFMLTCIPYAVYIIEVFVEVFSSATNESKTADNEDKSFKEKHDLTDREIEVYILAAQGLSNQDISKKLFVSVHTVKTHLQHIFSKLNVSTKYQLINFDNEHKDK